MNAKAASLLSGTVVLVLAVLAWPVPAQQGQPAGKGERPPHGQSTMPGPALSPAEAIKKMTVPPGFHVELVAAEPAIVNPVAMTFDERGRIWITESIEYPRRSAGPGKDRVKVLESTNGDGKFDKITTVIEGLNIPSGIAVGHGGVWVANSPDILFYPIEDFATPRLGKPQVVVTGFGRSDTHELPNSLTWGPDGWLYGLNGVFNYSHIKHKGKDYKFTCALFKIHPQSKDFEVFCEGTSNPWGLAINENGDFFVSACVIDHLWHLVETGYYHRQGGPYPPYTWPIGSIVKHRHQQAAYCGLLWFDSEAYPPEYREKLYMGNIHGNCINSDELTRDGSTYFARPRPDFLTAHDAWFMPVAQKVGPDGCMYILDWYDRYHCYQDANRDPKGIDRQRGRLYRVVYKDYKPAGKVDVREEERDKVVERLSSPNVFFRDTAQRVLSERLQRINTTNSAELLATEKQLRDLVRDEAKPLKVRMHATWALFGGGYTTEELLTTLLEHRDPRFRAWGVRHAGPLRGGPTPRYVKMAVALAKDASPDVQLQVAIAATKFEATDPLPVLLDVLSHCGDDKLIPHIVWQDLHPLLEKDGERFLTLAAKADLVKVPGLAKVLPRAIDRILGNPSGDPGAVVKFIGQLTAKNKADATAKLCIVALTVKVQNGEIPSKQLVVLKREFLPVLRSLMADNRLRLEAAVLAASLKDTEAIQALRKQFGATEQFEGDWLAILEALTAAGDTSVLGTVGTGLADPKTGSRPGRARMLAALGRLDNPQVAQVVLASYPKMEPELQPKAIELLTQRPGWARALFKEIADRRISKDVINVNQARRLLASKDPELARLVKKYWGMPRDSRNPERERIVAAMRTFLTKQRGDATAGWKVFKNVCGQCHKIYGEGVDVGPDITSNGRSDFDQLLSNVFDPSLVIGAGYQATTVATTKGQVLTGLVVEDNAQRVVLKTQGGKLETIPRGEVEMKSVSQVSLMPEGLEKQLRPQELADLFAFLTLDRPPDDPRAKRIPGAPR